MSKRRRERGTNKIVYTYLLWPRRFQSCGFKEARAYTMVQVYDSIAPAERKRIEKIEMLDEGELLVQLFQHYCLVVAWTGQLFQEEDIP